MREDEEKVYAILMAEAPLETLPQGIAGTPRARRVARRYGVEPGRLLLDISLFYREMKQHRVDPARGRPDIVHMFLQATSYSPLALEGRLRIYLHTRTGLLVRVKPGTRPPKNYYQFTKLMMQLLEHGRVPPSGGEPLMEVERVSSVEEVLRKTGSHNPILLHEKAPMPSCRSLWPLVHPPNIFVVGGFPRGDYGPEWTGASSRMVSVSPHPLDAWLAADRLIACLERGLGISL